MKGKIINHLSICRLPMAFFIWWSHLPDPRKLLRNSFRARQVVTSRESFVMHEGFEPKTLAKFLEESWKMCVETNALERIYARDKWLKARRPLSRKKGWKAWELNQEIRNPVEQMGKSASRGKCRMQCILSFFRRFTHFGTATSHISRASNLMDYDNNNNNSNTNSN